MDIDNAASFRHALLNEVNLFIGAGFSVLAQDAAGRPLPVGNQLPAELRSHFDLVGTDALNLSQLYTLLARTNRREVDSYLRERLTVSKFDDRYLHVRRVAAAAIFTTNIDNLLQSIFRGSHTTYLNDLDLNGPTYGDRRAVDFYAMHGSVLNPDRSLRFGSVDVASSFDADPDRWRYLRHRLRAAPTFFMGYSLQDAAALEALATNGGKVLADTWIQVLPTEAASATADYFRALDFQLVVGGTDQLLKYFSYNIPKTAGPGTLPRDRSRSHTNTLFPSDAVPDADAVPSRPVSDFFRGFAPGWSDVYSSTVRRTSHYRTLAETARRRRASIVTGIPGSGKTTLLMQIAASLEFSGHKLMLDGPTPEKAELVLRLLDGAPALVVIDNVTNHAAAFNIVRHGANVTVLGGDRDFNLSSSLHRLDRQGVTIIDVTELTDADLQDLRDSIPGEVRRDARVVMKFDVGSAAKSL